MSTLVDKWRDLWKKPKPQPTPDVPADVTPIPWVRVGLLLRSIPFQKLAPLFVSVPLIVFFALSGLLAWLLLLLRFAVNVFNVWT